MSRLLTAFLAIYMLTFVTGCQAKPVSNIDSTTKPVAVQEVKQGTINLEEANSSLSMDDLKLGGLKLRMSAEQAEQAMNSKPVKVVMEQDGALEKRFYEDIEMYIQNGELTYISTTSDKYMTPRGLKVGDSLDKLIKLYGTPSQIYNNVYSYSISDEYYLFHVKISDGKVISIQVNLAC